MLAGRLVPLAVLAAAVTAGRAAAADACPLPMPTKAQTSTCAPAAPCAPAAQPAPRPCEPERRICLPPSRIKVIVPPPEVILRYPGKGCNANAAAQPCQGGAAAPAPAQLAFKMDFTMPSMSYQMSPMLMATAAYGGGFAGMGGVPFAAGMPVGFGGFPVAAGGFPALTAGGVGTNPLAALLSLLGGGGAASSDTQLLRALQARLAGGAATNGEADADLEARLVKLNNTLNTKLQEELNKVRTEMTGKMTDGMKEMLKLIDKLEERVKKLEPKP